MLWHEKPAQGRLVRYSLFCLLSPGLQLQQKQYSVSTDHEQGAAYMISNSHLTIAVQPPLAAKKDLLRLGSSQFLLQSCSLRLFSSCWTVSVAASKGAQMQTAAVEEKLEKR